MATKTKSSYKHAKFTWLIAFSVFITDQISKLLVQNSLPLWNKVAIIPNFFNIVYVLNKGAAFGFLNNPQIVWQSYFFIAISLIAIFILSYLVRTTKREDRLFFLGISLIMGGALGNLVDRIRLGMVVDFLDFYVASFHWPAFNIADAAISLGTIVLLISFCQRNIHASDPN